MTEYTDEQLNRVLDSSKFTFAKSMKAIPHWWLSRSDVRDHDLFNSLVTFIKANGKEERFGAGYFSYYRYNGYKYWTMAAHLKGTMIINKALIEPKHPYDIAAENYDKLFSRKDFKNEEAEIFEILGEVTGSVLDIGCGTGLVLDYINPSSYLGIDPSQIMLKMLKRKHHTAKVMNIPFRKYYDKFKDANKPDNIIGIFSASYVEDPAKILEVWKGTGKIFLIFYKEDYSPYSHQYFGIKPNYRNYQKHQLKQMFHVEPLEYKNYYIVKIEK